MLHLRRHIFALFFAGMPLIGSAAAAQETSAYGGRSSIEASVSYAPTSQHILIGNAENRETSQLSIGYSHTIKKWSNVRISYEGSVVPLYLESDPTFASLNIPSQTGQTTVVPFDYVYRPIAPNEIVGYIRFPIIPGDSNEPLPITGNLGPREQTYAFAALPIGSRVTGFTHRRVQPTFAINLGALYATRNIPIDYTSSFNFLAYAGPGIEVFYSRRESIRIEYLYEHMSNAELGFENPGIDSATFRVTIARFRARQ